MDRSEFNLDYCFGPWLSSIKLLEYAYANRLSAEPVEPRLFYTIANQIQRPRDIAMVLGNGFAGHEVESYHCKRIL